MERSKVRVGMEVLALFPVGLVPATITRVASRWRGDPNVVMVKTENGQEHRFNVSWLEEKGEEVEDE